MSVEVNPRGFEIRRIAVNQEIGCAGYGVEILDGGRGGYQNKLVLGRGLFGTTQAHPDDCQIPCTPGNRVISTFDFLRLKQETVSPTEPDYVTVKVHTTRTAVFVDTPQPGVVKKQWYARGSATIPTGAGGALRVWKSADYNNGIAVDDYHTDPQLDVRAFWTGWVTANNVGFSVWILAAHTDTDGSAVYRPVQVLGPHDFSGTFPSSVNSPTADPAWAIDFCTGASPTTTQGGSGVPIAYPGGAVEVWIVNTAVIDIDVQYLIGVRGN